MQSICDGVHHICPTDEWACYDKIGTFNDVNFQEYLDQAGYEAAAKRKFVSLLINVIESESLSIEHELPEDTIGGPPMKRSQHVWTLNDPTT